MAFSPLYFLVPVKANVLPLRRRLDALAIGAARRWFGQATLALAFPLAQRIHDPRPDPGTPPAAKVAVDRLPRSKLFGAHAPLTARLGDVKNAMDDAAAVHRLPP